MEHVAKHKNPGKTITVRQGCFFPGRGSGAFFIQPKLTIGQPNDPGSVRDEQEADNMAEKVLHMGSGEQVAQPFFKPNNPPLQRKCAECEEEEKHLQRKKGKGKETAALGLEKYVERIENAGQPLPAKTREFFEPRFGYDFSRVKVHTDNVAAKSAQSINALAYTSGKHIVFNEGQFAPDTASGKKLLGHELTHVIQQSQIDSGKLHPKIIQKAPTIHIVEEDFVGPLQQDQRRAAASCPVRCSGVINVGTLHAMGLFYHRSRTGVREAPAASDNGVGTALHFLENSGRRGCPCDGFKIIQIISTSHPAAGRDGAGYVDNGGRSTPFYSDVYSGGQGEHTISVAGGFRDQGERVDTTHSIYDTPYRSTTGMNSTITWMAEACVACIKDGAPDIVMGGATYGFTLPFNSGTNSFDTIRGIGPDCISTPSWNFIHVLETDPTVSGYDFTPEIGPGDFPTPDPDTRYA